MGANSNIYFQSNLMKKMHPA